jgi:hypothetical protein
MSVGLPSVFIFYWEADESDSTPVVPILIRPEG